MAPLRALLAFQALTVSLGEHRPALAVSGALLDGGVLWVRGPSGAGKSTLLRVLARLQERRSGSLTLRGRPAEEILPPVWRRRVAYVAQHPAAFDGSVLDNIRRPFSLSLYRGETPPGEANVRDLAAALLLPPALLHQDARTLSGGELARVALMRAVFTRPWVLLLDEPVAALDSEAREAVFAFLGRWVRGEALGEDGRQGAGRDKQAPGRGVILVSHQPDGGHLPEVASLSVGGRPEAEDPNHRVTHDE